MNRIALWLGLIGIAALWAVPARAADDRWHSRPARPGGDVVLRIVMLEDEAEDPAAAGKKAAEMLKEAMGDAPLKAVLISEVFEDLEYKKKLLDGIGEVIDKNILLGGATYGSYTQDGCTDFDAVALLGIGGDGIGAAAALVTEQGTAKLDRTKDLDTMRGLLHAAGERVTRAVPKTRRDQLLIFMANAHAPSNRYLVEGAQKVVGPEFPITGGSVNVNAGQTFTYFRGKPYEDASVAIMLSGDFHVSLSGGQGMETETVIATARDAAAEALEDVEGTPLVVLAFNCAGRRSQLDDYDVELAATQDAIGKELPLFGLYCAGEIGPVDESERQPGVLSGGTGWHVMYTIISR